ncbi:SpoIIE family protein phosphatase [Streptomyces sp. enrichment culture]|uniref:PP2C family protein-serine/threonine phosphatase n=1 Tax=Streptomyces sp. enrichment culture TaxID=1795815 RepID=UPI003F560603
MDTTAEGAEPGDENAGTVPGEAIGDTLALIGTGAYAVDGRGTIVAVNAVAERMLDRSAAELVGADAHDLLHRNARGESMPTSQCRMRPAFLAGRPAQDDDEWYEKGDGTLLPVAWSIVPCAAGAHDALVLVLFHPREAATGAHGRATAREGTLDELERLALLAETTTQLTSTLSVDEALRRLVSLVLPRLADWAVVDLISEHDEVWRTKVVHLEDGVPVSRHDLEGPMAPVPAESPMPLSRALRGVSSTIAGPETYERSPDSGIAVEQRRLFEATGMHSAAIAPIRGLREVLGALTLGRSEQAEAFTPADLTLLEDITRRAGLALDNARLYQRQRKVAETMQRYLLPQLPRVTGLEMTSRYLPAPDASHVGGDWYDAFTLGDGDTALVIGDVSGHDLEAAAGMAQLRNVLRSYAWSQNEPPGRVVERVDRAVLRITDVSMATLVLAVLGTDEEGRWTLRWTNAGHPPPLLVTHEGVAGYLTDGGGMLLGTGADRPRGDGSTVLPPGSTLVLYTDGLIESPTHSIDEGLERLRRHAAVLAHRTVEAFTDELLRRARPADNDDDVALLAVRVGTRPGHGGPA